MAVKRVLLFYISVNSGHQAASVSLEESIRIQGSGVETLNINYFKYTSPVLSKVVIKTYHNILKMTPEFWDYLYDNDSVRKKTMRLRNIMHKVKGVRMRRLMRWYKPDVVVCTQAFPCIAVAEYKRAYGENIPLIGVSTDYGIHSYWVDRSVDMYIVPTKESKQRLINLGVAEKRIETIGIPISPRFYAPLDKEKIREKFGIRDSNPLVLIMGGSRGMISMDSIVRRIAKASPGACMAVVCGMNRQLYKKLLKIMPEINAKVHLFRYVNNIEELMSISSMLITKPGGLTTTEALVKELPMIIINPIPGQELKNTDFLLKNNTALLAEDAEDIARCVHALVSSPRKMDRLRGNARRIMGKNASFEIAERIVKWKDKDAQVPALQAYS